MAEGEDPSLGMIIDMTCQDLLEGLDKMLNYSITSWMIRRRLHTTDA